MSTKKQSTDPLAAAAAEKAAAEQAAAEAAKAKAKAKAESAKAKAKAKAESEEDSVRSALKEAAKQHFDNHPKCNVIYATEDGNFWLAQDKSFANNYAHARKMKMYEFKR
jgi:hypothetical protein